MANKSDDTLHMFVDVCPCDACTRRRQAGQVLDSADLLTLERHLIGALKMVCAISGRRIEIVDDRRPKRRRRR